MTILWQLLGAFFAALGFAGLFQIRGKKLWLSAVGGIFCWAAYLVATQLGCSELVAYFFSGVVSTLYGEIFARVQRAPVTTFLIPALIVAVPGSLLYSTMDAMVQNNWQQAGEFASRTGVIALALAGGVMVVTSVQKIWFGQLQKRRAYGKETI